jgi:hypothetical protein
MAIQQQEMDDKSNENVEKVLSKMAVTRLKMLETESQESPNSKKTKRPSIHSD